MHVVLDGLICLVLSFGLSGLVSTIPCASLFPCGLSWTEVQVHDNTQILCYTFDSLYSS